jgi:hypothetical protein
MKKFLNLVLVFFGFSIVNVYATNDVDYRLTITDDYKFNEIITYSISDYKQPANGDNHFYDIINSDVYTDILGKTKYAKTVKQQGDKYIVTLAHTYSELTYSNAYFMNSCFQKPQFTYDVDKYVFSSSGYFNCFYGDSLKITITTNKNVSKSNATKTGNNYVWFPPTSGPFNMEFQINKTYDPVVRKSDEEEIYDDIDEDETLPSEAKKTTTPAGTADLEDIDDTDETESASKKKDDSNPYVLLFTSGVFVAAILVVVITLKIKKDRINRL